MAQYKVPQDVEADDKLIGPFSFRQFVYLLIAAGLVAAAVGLFQIFPLLAIIPLPPVLLFLILALPLKKDQPMETYLAAVVSYYLKPHERRWTPGQRESTILITAPKIVEDTRTRDITEEEATHRLSFLADIMDSQGYSIKSTNNNSMREDLVAEANTITDMFDTYKAENIEKAIDKDKIERHEEVIRGMREAIDRSENLNMSNTTIQNDRGKILENKMSEPPMVESHESVVAPVTAPVAPTAPAPAPTLSAAIVLPDVGQKEATAAEKTTTISPKPSIMELANNSDFTVATIAKEANRINRKDDGEVFISLH